MEIDQEIVLRPRFQKSLSMTREVFMRLFDGHHSDKHYIVSKVDAHVFIRIPESRSHFWSPELHLEVQEETDGLLLLKGLYGPKPAVWTMFMFLHFLISGFFIAALIWLYTLFTLKKAMELPLIVMILMVLIWVVLYISGRMGRKKGEDQMKELQQFLDSLLETEGV
ncbi:GTP-binding protein [Nonlabens sp. MB-3u-79]|uniref:GTP-binding protein n=1 Tax=Nonlabens sp. MB-3u-79 TaxID=2058134 RepID=UPI000C3015E3|nr:GTP-binding protein [Nonlabens sp. MB-3u-79]AUC79735.1 GTP-binding protein [Nonlabens sp. MB-3u-79]|tara:strand:- start:1091 stop:1591 length:501 start_codon:yes stop_codon:yes gene_type:complete